MSIPKQENPLHSLFNANSVAIFGASRNFMRWGSIILHNMLLGNFKGKIYPINPKYDEIMGLKVYKTIDDVPETVDVAVMALRSKIIPRLISACALKGVKVLVVISAGFAEVGKDGKRLQDQLVEIAKANNIRVVGPNGMGVFSASVQLNALMVPMFPKYGPVSFISQSGNLGTIAMHWAMERGVGFNKFVSSGNEADLRMAEYIDYLAEDDTTGIIASYIEGLSDGRALIESLSHAAIKKPTIVLKGGTTTAGNRAAFSHTSAIAQSSTKMLEDVFSQTGVLSVDNLDELFELVSVFSKQPLPKGRRVGILTVGGGWGVIAADACEKEGLCVSNLSPQLISEINKILPPFWSRQNPVDTVGILGVDAYEKLLELMATSDDFDGLLFLGFGFYSYFSQLWTESRYIQQDILEILNFIIEQEILIMKKLVELIQKYKKPILVATLMASKEAKCIRLLKDRGYPALPSPESAARAFAKMAYYNELNPEWESL